MTEKILFFVSKEGEILIDFSGFRPGNDCISVGEKFQALLKEYGVEIDITQQVKKDIETDEVVNRNAIKH
ncbi:MAG: hypothetical protein HXS54_01215 [Theionarchaea archaeon]|nr:hypothetical protein [Theionarchaea archaeon]